MQALISNGLVIRPFAASDATAFRDAVLESIHKVGAWMWWCHANYSLQDAESWIESCTANLESSKAYDVGIFDAQDGILLGGVSINEINQTHNFGNIGYWVRQGRQREGIAYRAVRVIAEFGFAELKLTRLEIIAAEYNIASRRTAEKAGATLECIARNRLLVHGKPSAAAVYSLVPTAS